MGSSPDSEIPQAPAFSADGYPLGGVRIGPAWETAWRLLHEYSRVSTEILLESMQQHGVTESTARTILGRAAKVGLIAGASWGGRRGLKVLAWQRTGLTKPAARVPCWLCLDLGGIEQVHTASGRTAWLGTAPSEDSPVRPCPLCHPQTSRGHDVATDPPGAQTG
jgi:hypothetical protein